MRVGKYSYMLPNHVHSDALQDMEIKDHRLQCGWSIDSIGPVSLVQSAELEDKLSVQKGPFDSLDRAYFKGSESCIAAHLVVPHLDADVVEVWRVGAPQFRRGQLEAALLV